MQFYEDLSQVYDIVFPKNENTFQFLSKGLNKKSKILDIACGTGNYAIAFAEKGYEVDGIDLDEHMIKRGKEKAKKDLNIHFFEGDMTKIKEMLYSKKYDLIYCIGNSIVHLESKEKIQNLIKDISDMLHEGGSLIIQIVNYDRIIKYHIDHLPTIYREKEGIKLIRKYVHNEERTQVDFHTELIIANEDKNVCYKNSIPLIALQSKTLKEMIEKANFSTIDFYGSFLEEAYNDQSFALVVRAMK